MMEDVVVFAIYCQHVHLFLIAPIIRYRIVVVERIRELLEVKPKTKRNVRGTRQQLNDTDPPQRIGERFPNSFGTFHGALSGC